MAMRLFALAALATGANAQGWTFDGLTTEQQQIVQCTRNDINSDGFVGVDDLLSVLSHYHFTCTAQFDFETCDVSIPGSDALCGESADCQNFPAPEPAPAAEPCPAPAPPCPAPEPSSEECPDCNCDMTSVPLDADALSALFPANECVLDPAELIAGTAAQAAIAAFIERTATSMGVDASTLSVAGLTADGLLNSACESGPAAISHEVSVELSNGLIGGISGGETDGNACSLSAAEIAADPEAQMLACAMRQAQAAALDGVYCDDTCTVCDIVMDAFDFSGTDGCDGSGRRALKDGVPRAHFELDPRFTAKIHKVYEVVHDAALSAL